MRHFSHTLGRKFLIAFLSNFANSSTNCAGTETSLKNIKIDPLALFVIAVDVSISSDVYFDLNFDICNEKDQLLNGSNLKFIQQFER